jgi:hypothetical protein
VICSSETSVDTPRTTRRYILEDGTLPNGEILKLYVENAPEIHTESARDHSSCFHGNSLSLLWQGRVILLQLIQNHKQFMMTDHQAGRAHIAIIRTTWITAGEGPRYCGHLKGNATFVILIKISGVIYVLYVHSWINVFVEMRSPISLSPRPLAQTDRHTAKRYHNVKCHHYRDTRYYHSMGFGLTIESIGH